MSFGMRVWGERAELVMDTTTFTYQVIWQGVIDFSQSGGLQPTIHTIDIPGFHPDNCVFMIIPTRPQDVQSSESDTLGNIKSYPYVTTWVGRVEVRSCNPSTQMGSTNQTRIVAQAYAVRFA